MYGGSTAQISEEGVIMIVNHLAAITLAFLLDLLIGDPPKWPHPVRWIGSFILYLDKKWNKGERRRLKGTAMVLAVLGTVFLAASLIAAAGYVLHPLAGIVIEAVLISTTIAQKSLKEAAMEVYGPLHEGNLREARLKLSYIVGRDTDKLDEPEIVRGTVETVAENTSDGITAPLFWALIGGAPLALVYRAANTCDSMAGYKNEKYLHFGWASARLDDLLNFIPARLTGLLMLLGKKPEHSSFKETWAILLRDSRKHPSPNSGWGEAAAAALMGVQLGGINFYKSITSDRARMGDPIVILEKGHILSVIEIMKRTCLLFLLFLWLGGMLIELAFAWI
jgi:adenosylcobinamide-phosphate synthase